MRSKYFFRTVFLVVFAGSIAINPVNAQTANSSADSLYREIAHMDSVLFNAFNTRDTELFKTLFTKDLEFYHDKGGLTNYEHTIGFILSIAKNDNGLKRELVKGS